LLVVDKRKDLRTNKKLRWSADFHYNINIKISTEVNGAFDFQLKAPKNGAESLFLVARPVI
jgi:hypothetical protein